MKRLAALKQSLKGFLLVKFLFFALVLNANNNGKPPVTGKVTDENGAPVSGATVTVKGADLQTTTDETGSFSFADVASDATITISKDGYATSEIPLNAQSVLNISLKKRKDDLNEVVVIGYGTARKRDLVSAVSVISAKEAGQTAATNPAQLLIGKAAGVQIVNTSGTPGAAAQIIVRGTGSLTNLNPLFVVDGIQADGNAFNSLSPQEIENITILKDAASTAIYGAAAANGVVVITTKKGRSGAPKVFYSNRIGVSKAWKQLDILKTKDYIDLMRDYALGKPTTLPAKFSPANSGSLTDQADYQKEIFRNALTTENYVSVNGGGEKVTYNFSVGYITQEAIVKNYRHDRLNLKFGLEENVGRFKFGQTLILRHTKNKGQQANLIDALTYAPYKPINDASVPGGYSIVVESEDLSNTNNPLAPLGLRTSEGSEFVLYPQFFGEVNILKGLKFRSQASFTLGYGYSNSYQLPYTASNNLAQARQATESMNRYNTYTIENYATYNRSAGKHNIGLTLGNSYINKGSSKSSNILGTNFINDDIRNIVVAGERTVSGASIGFGTYFGTLISYFGRATYSYDNKYFLSASVRRDGSSNFGTANRFGNFPGIGASWKFSEEDFIKNNASFLSDGKFRIGWGRTGNNNVPLFRTEPNTYSGITPGSLVYSFGTTEAFANGTTLYTLPNPNLKWEETDQTDIGLDLAFFDNKLSLTLDWYKRLNKDLLVDVFVPTSSGIGGLNGSTSSQFGNAATAENKGIEIAIGYRNISKSGLGYNFSVNGAFNKNNTISLGTEFAAPLRDGAFNNLKSITYTNAGSAIGSFYGYRVDHVARDAADIAAYNANAPVNSAGQKIYQTGLEPGDFIFKDLNGDNVINDKDQEILGSPIPKFTYGINGGLNYKNFDVNLVISGVSGVQLVNANKFFTENLDKGHNVTTALLDRWTKPGDVKKYPRAGQNANGDENLRPSDFFVEDGNYMRVRNLTIGYNIPKKLLTSIGNGKVISSLRVYVSAENLLTITNYSGYDPEVSTQGGGGGTGYITRRGIDQGQLPQSRILMGGIQVGF
jgi:TonB-dependent starch-binding outer membrane protein SusC